MIAALLVALSVVCTSGQDATLVLQALLDTGQDVTLPPQDRECPIRTLRMRIREQTLTAHGVTFRTLGAPTDPMLVMAADWTTVRGGIWIGRGGTYPGPSSYGVGLIEVRDSAYVRVTEATLIDAPASAVAITGATNTEVSRTRAREPRGRAILISESPWSVVVDSIIEAPRHDGVSILLGSAFSSVTKSLIDYTRTREWSVDPLAPWCGYVQGVVAWGGSYSASVTWTTVLGSAAPRPDCHLFIGISLANGSDRSKGWQNTVDCQGGGQSGITYGLEIADASDSTYDTNRVFSCQTGISTGSGGPAFAPTERALLKGNRVEDSGIDGVTVFGGVKGVRVEGNIILRAGTPINVWTHIGGTPRDVEVVGNDTGEAAP